MNPGQIIVTGNDLNPEVPHAKVLEDAERTAFLAGYEMARRKGDARVLDEDLPAHASRKDFAPPASERKAINDEFDKWKKGQAPA